MPSSHDSSQTMRRGSTRGSKGGTVAEGGDIMTLQEIAGHLRVHVTTIYRLLKNGGLPGFKVGGVWRFDREPFETWLMQQQRTTGRGRRGRVKRKSDLD